MKSLKQIQAGHKRRVEGLQFERILETQARLQGILCIKMPLGCERRGKILVQVKTPFDYILIDQLGQSVYIDCKSIDSDRFSHSLVKPHQAYALEAIQHHKCQAGYIINFRKNNNVVFFDAQKLVSLRYGESLKEGEGLFLGTVEELCLGTLFV